MNNDTFTFRAVVDFEITVEEAAHILSDPMPNAAMNQWLIRNSPASDGFDEYNTGKLKEALGVCLAQQKVNDCKLLAVSTGAA